MSDSSSALSSSSSSSSSDVDISESDSISSSDNKDEEMSIMESGKKLWNIVSDKTQQSKEQKSKKNKKKRKDISSTSLSLPSSRKLGKLNEKVKREVVNEYAELSLKIIKLIKSVESIKPLIQHKTEQGKNAEPKAPEDVNLNLLDIKTNRDLPLDVQYKEFTMWKHIMRSNADTASFISSSLKQYKQENKSNEQDEVNDNKNNDNTVEDQTHQPTEGKGTFEEFYKQQYTECFGDDLDSLRQKTKMDSKKMRMMVDLMESGMDMFSDFEKELCVETYHSPNINKSF